MVAKPSLHMAGVLVHCLPAKAEAVGAQIAGMTGAVLHTRSANGRLVVTLESERSADILDGIARIQRMAGVLSAALVSEHSEPLENVDEEIPDGCPNHAP